MDSQWAAWFARKWGGYYAGLIIGLALGLLIGWQVWHG